MATTSVGHQSRDKQSPRGRLTEADLIPDRALATDDPDAFEHSLIAARVADLVTEAATPLNVGLFGPWGSGKSSFCELLRRELARDRRGAIKVVRYEAAWKFGGTALERNFISHVARELDLDEDDKENREFYRGLYEKRRSVDIDVGRLRDTGLAVFRSFAIVLAAVGLVLILMLGVIAWISDTRTWVSLIETTLPQVFASSAAVALVVAVLKLVLTGASIEVEQSQPADEEFSGTFERLVRKVMKKGGRLVFFIDELDRSSAEDVVATLATIKNFLGHKDCVFIIAADRDVLEKALNKLPQETPANEEEPYYSTASAFLDKIFQHQVSLPPLRARRLTRFARDLVAQRAPMGGLWTELQAHEEGGRLLEDVVHALIPSHVRSPRRVKVLLNNFATNARVAESRGIDYLGRAAEIAKLTVLETEFPLLASDLHLEPRLPSALLEAMENGHAIEVSSEVGSNGASDGEAATHAPRSESRLERLIARYRRGAGGRLLGDCDAETTRLNETRSNELRRYLQRAAAARIPDPGRDLLYLEAAGAAVGLDDAELAEFVELVAPDAPVEVVSRLADRPHEERRAAARLLADMAEQSFGEERSNIILGLMGVAEGLREEAAPIAGELAKALNSFLVVPESSLGEGFLVGALVIARLAETGPDAPLTDRLFADERLLSDASRVESVSLLAAGLPQRHLAKLHERIAVLFPSAPDVLLEPLRELPAANATLMMRSEFIVNAIAARLSEASSEGSNATELASDLMESSRSKADTTPELQALVQWALLQSGTSEAYMVAKHVSPVLLPKLADRNTAACHAVRALALAPPEDWPIWIQLLPADIQTTPPLAEQAEQATLRVITEAAEAPEAARKESPAVVNQLSGWLPGASWSALGQGLQESLNARQWWTSPDERAKQEALHSVARELAPVEGIRENLDDMLRVDIERALAAQQPPFEDAVIGAGSMGAFLMEASASAISTGLAGMYSEESGDAPLDFEITLARARIACQARKHGSDVSSSPFSLGLEKLGSAIGRKTGAGRKALHFWLQTQPPVDEVATVVLKAGDIGGQSIGEVGTWSEHISEQQRTDLLIELAHAAMLTERWIAEVGTFSIDEVRIVADLAGRMQAATRAQERGAFIRLIVAIRPDHPDAQRQVAELTIWLLARDTDADFRNALDLAPALGARHRSTRRLETSFRKAAEKRKIPAKAEADLRRAGIELPKKTFAEKVVRRIKPHRE